MILTYIWWVTFHQKNGSILVKNNNTPKHGSWLNIAEIELSVLKRQCLAGRIASIEKMRDEVHIWNVDRNNRQSKVDWQFYTKDARIKLKRLYPKL